jgi:hypothetical protein
MSSTVGILGTILGAVFLVAGLFTAASLLPLMAVIGAVAGVCTYTALENGDGRFATRWRRSPRRLAAMTTIGTIAGIYVAIGVIVLLGAALGALLLAAAVAVAVVAHRVLRGRRTAAASEAPPDPALPTDSRQRRPALLPDDAATATTSQLCRAWRVSYLILENTRDPVRLAEVAAIRRAYLDELDRRDPGGFRRWLEDGARAAGDPARYIGTGSASPEREDDAAA